MKRNPRIEIRTKESSSSFTEVYVNGHKLDGVRRYTLRHDPEDGIPVLTVDLNALDLAVDVECIMMHPGYGEIEEIKFKKSECVD